MWARVVEVMLAGWLAISPFVFGHEPGRTDWWMKDFAGAGAVAVFALLSYWKRLEKIHLFTVVVAGWLIAGAFFSATVTAPAEQNHLVVGLLLLMLAVIPSRSNQPPRGWVEFYRHGSDSTDGHNKRRSHLHGTTR